MRRKKKSIRMITGMHIIIPMIMTMILSAGTAIVMDTDMDIPIRISRQNR